MTEHQLDLFSDAAARMEPCPPHGTRSPVVAADMDDAALIAALPQSSLAESSALAAEAARRRLGAAIPGLAVLCRRFAGFGAERVVPEQVDALRALAAIGGREAAQAVSTMICKTVVQGPTLVVAVAAAAQLNATLPAEVLGSLLQHADPILRAAACQCARQRSPEVMALLAGLLVDTDRAVASAAACALGRLGRSDARPALKALLCERPSRDVVESVSAVADEECMVLLGRLARTTPDLADAALDALESIDHPRASAIAETVRQLPRS